LLKVKSKKTAILLAFSALSKMRDDLLIQAITVAGEAASLTYPLINVIKNVSCSRSSAG
jgi:hypothetical protein